MLKVLLVDDEPLAHEVLVHHCRSRPDIEIVGQCRNAAEALAVLGRTHVDLMFLDIRMPRFGGLDLLRGLDSPPLTIIVSAHREHALDGFELDVVDYLLKPVGAQRFADALDKARRRLAEQGEHRTLEPEVLALRVDRTTRRVRLDRVACFQAQGNFVQVWSDEGNFLATTTLRKLIEALPQGQFAQVHRSFVVRRDRVVAQSGATLCLDTGMDIPIGRSYRKLTLIR